MTIFRYVREELRIIWVVISIVITITTATNVVAAERQCPLSCDNAVCPALTNCEKVNLIQCRCAPDGPAIAGLVIGIVAGVGICCGVCCYFSRCCCFSYRKYSAHTNQLTISNNTSNNNNQLPANPLHYNQNQNHSGFNPQQQYAMSNFPGSTAGISNYNITPSAPVYPNHAAPGVQNTNNQPAVLPAPFNNTKFVANHPSNNIQQNNLQLPKVVKTTHITYFSE
jgi:hypothetical protein